MLVSEEDYNKPLNIRNKNADNVILSLKFYNAIYETLNHILCNPNELHTIKNRNENITLTNERNSRNNFFIIKELYSHKIYDKPEIILEHSLNTIDNFYPYEFSSNCITKIVFDKSLNIKNYITKQYVTNHTDKYLNFFNEMTSSKSKNFKKKILKAVYLFENDTGDIKYRHMFDFIVNRFDFYINHYVNNYDMVNRKLINPKRTASWCDRYYLNDYNKILTKQELRKHSINSILKK